nr:MAG TPA: hypothetical protein [Bacteriophage sp.]
MTPIQTPTNPSRPSYTHLDPLLPLVHPLAYAV